ncbi:MAG TPA: sterol desaturase family protein, partial [Gemmatimonadales bacterium]|nr:sterol desaturase family protein [Gemmatimonadales bacterium]
VVTQNLLRSAFFFAGLFTLLSWELAAPHHSPTVPRLRRWAANLGLAAINGGVVAGLCAACYAIAVAGALPWRAGPLELLGPPLWVRLPVEIALLDLVVYGLHRAYHRAPWLWRFHQVHHSDLDLDVTSASRFHLGEVLVSAGGKFTAVMLLGISPLGLVAFETVMLLAAQFQHANVRVRPAVERLLWWTFVPPAMHRVHHHPARADTDSNFGTLLVCWDRLFGTLRRAERDTAAFGLPEIDRARALRFGGLLVMPFRRADPPGPSATAR